VIAEDVKNVRGHIDGINPVCDKMKLTYSGIGKESFRLALFD